MPAEREAGQMPAAAGSFCPALVSPAAIAKLGLGALEEWAEIVHPRHRALRPCETNQRVARDRRIGIALAHVFSYAFGVEMASADRQSMLRRALSRYLRANAQACDTVDGIARWWMPSGFNVSETEVLLLLDELREKGLITRFSTLEGRWLYRRSGIDARSDQELERMTTDTHGSH